MGAYATPPLARSTSTALEDTLAGAEIGEVITLEAGVTYTGTTYSNPNPCSNILLLTCTLLHNHCCNLVLLSIILLLSLFPFHFLVQSNSDVPVPLIDVLPMELVQVQPDPLPVVEKHEL